MVQVANPSVARRALPSTSADRAVDFSRAADAYSEAASLIARANSLMEHHGVTVSYAKSVGESVEEWAHTADRHMRDNLDTANRRINE